MLTERIQMHTKLSARHLEWYASTASRRYKLYEIKKKNGGNRSIAHPSKELKAIQRWICKAILNNLPIHDSATGYRVGIGIKTNAALHAATNFTLRVDFESFFPSFEQQGVEKFISLRNNALNLSLTAQDINFVSRIVCRHGRLTIGAPTSPVLTNSMMYDFDCATNEWCQSRNLVYSRYADDIFISSNSPNCLHEALEFVKAEIRKHSFANLKLNTDKTIFLSRRYKRTVTGLVISSTREISIGLERKLAIKDGVYKFKLGRLEPEKIGSLAGMISFVKDVELSFYNTLCRKYGIETIRRIQLGR